MTTYPQELWADNATGELSGAPSSGAITFGVTTLTGTFPSPSSGQAFHCVINFGESNAEMVEVTANSAGTFTTSALVNNHSIGEPIEAVITAEGLNSILNPARSFGTPSITFATPYANPNPYDSQLTVEFGSVADTITVQISVDGGSTWNTTRTVVTSGSVVTYSSQWLPVGVEIQFTRAGSATITGATIY